MFMKKIVIPISENFCKSINSTYSKLTRTTIHLDYSHLSVFAEKKDSNDKTRTEQNKSVSEYVIQLFEKGLIEKPQAIKILQDEKVIT